MKRLYNILKNILSHLKSKKNTASQVEENKNRSEFIFNLGNWAELTSQSKNHYTDSNILNKITDAAIKLKKGEIIYERDSVIFDTIQYSWPLIAILLKISVENNAKLKVIDFGGALGSTFFQNRHFLSVLKTVEWNIIEQPSIVKIGKEKIEDTTLKFYHTLEECLNLTTPNVIILSGVLQCLENPYGLIEEILNQNFDYILIDRTSFIEKHSDMLSLQVVHKNNKKTSLPAWFFNEQSFIDKFNINYSIFSSFNSYCDPPINVKGKKLYWKGFILTRKQQNKND